MDSSDRRRGNDPDIGDPPDSSGTPRWVKVFGVVLAIAALLAVIVFLAGGGQHGPGRHAALDTTVGQAGPADPAGRS
jgi:hypothetical protein